MDRRDLLTDLIIKGMVIKGRSDLKAMHNNSRNARKKNEKLLFSILKKNKNTEFGRKYHFADIKSVEDYRRMVPMTNYSDYEDYVRRMIDNNEENLITALEVVGYAQSSGSVGSRKFIPLTMEDVRIYMRYTVTRMMALADEYYRRNGQGGLKPGRGIFTDPGYRDYLPNGLPCTNVADVPAKQLSAIYPYILVTPFNRMFTPDDVDYRYVNLRFGLQDRKMMYIFAVFFKDVSDYFLYLKNNWESLVADIETGTIGELAKCSPETEKDLLTVIKPDPERAAELRAEFEKGFDETIIKRIWPNMQVIGAIGTSTFEPFTKLARQNTEGIIFDYSIYGASEGLFAAVDEPEIKRQLLLVDSCYYEFIPVEDEEKILPLDELEVGREYEIVITNQAGLYRYRCGDVIKVLGYLNECPYVVFSYRKGQLLNLTGEKTTEVHMREVVNAIEKKAGCTITHWAVYNCTDDHPYHYVLLLENEEGMDLRPYSEFAHETLRDVNIRYDHFFSIRRMAALQIENQKPGTNKAWMDKKVKEGVSPAQVKPVRIIDTPEKEDFFIGRNSEAGNR